MQKKTYHSPNFRIKKFLTKLISFKFLFHFITFKKNIQYMKFPHTISFWHGTRKIVDRQIEDRQSINARD